MERIPLAIEHVIFQAVHPYEKVIEALEARLGTQESQEAVIRLLQSNASSWEQISQIVSTQIGTSGFVLFSKVDHGQYLALVGKRGRAIQYAIGNPLFAAQMTGNAPEAALYAPLRMVVYEDEQGNTRVAYDSLVSQMAPYGEAICDAARAVEQRLERLVAAITALDP